MEKLKPCPFCGGEAYIAETEQGHFRVARCKDCHSQIMPCSKESQARKMWNRRYFKWNRHYFNWIETRERLPEQKTRVLISNGKSCDIGQLHEDWLDNILRRFWSVEGAENLDEDLITYWMPLPKPPEVEE